MSCKHLIWNCYCKHKQDFCERKLFPRLCEDYCREDEVDDMKKIFNKGPATNIKCACGTYNSTAENDYVSMLEMFINNLYTNKNFGLFGLTVEQAEEHVSKEMIYLGYNTETVNEALVDTINNFKTNHRVCIIRLNEFCNIMLMKPHKNYADYCSTSYKFVLTLILGYLGKLTSAHIVQCEDPQRYFENMINSKDVSLFDLQEAIQLTRYYVEAANDIDLAEGMRRFDAWWKNVAKETIPPKELTIADVEKQLGYKIKIVGEEN